MPRTRKPARPELPEQTRARLSELGKLGAHKRWAEVADRRAEMRAVHEARHRRYYAEADRQGVTNPELREAMAKNAEAAAMARMRLARMRSQQLAADAAAEAAEADRLAAELAEDGEAV